jgi:hypothetical protein
MYMAKTIGKIPSDAAALDKSGGCSAQGWMERSLKSASGGCVADPCKFLAFNPQIEQFLCAGLEYCQYCTVMT